MTRYNILALPFSLAVLSLSAWQPTPVAAQPATVTFHDCFSGNDSQKMNVSTVYAQIIENDGEERYLNLTVLGQTGQNISGEAQQSDHLATLFTDTEVLTLSVFSNRSYFCDTLRPPSPLPALVDNATDYCPIPAGDFAFSSRIPLGGGHELTTLSTRLRAVDPFTQEIFCADIYTTPLKPGTMGYVYGHAVIVFWASVALAIGYWTVVGIARLVSAWDRGTSRTGSGPWSKVEGAGYILASALSGERFASSPALMRFCTPSMRDIFFHTQYCAALGMVAVQWPSFVYPLISQTAWATLTYNITLTQKADTEHWNPLEVVSYDPPSTFSSQLNDPNSVLYVNTSAPNTLFMLPPETKNGIPAFAATIGVREQDLFGLCLSIFLALVAAATCLSLLVRALDGAVELLSSATRRSPQNGTRSPGPRYSAGSKDMLEGIGNQEEDRSMNSHFLFSRGRTQPGKSWKRRFFRSGLNSFHWNILHGNLVRLLLLFHFPITIFSCYQMTLGRSHATLVSIVLAALSFAILSVLIPVFFVARLMKTTTNKLYDETGTLLALGPLYNHYRHGSQLFACIFFATNIAFGLTIGAGQKSGTAQAIIILIIEVASALGTSVWLPWGQGASMGLISFLFCVARIVIAVLLVILTPVVSIGMAASGWVAYAVLFILAIVYATFILLLVVKLIEALVRIFGGIGFDHSKHVMDSGLIGACALLGCCGGTRQRNARRRRSRYRASELPRQAQEDAFNLPSKAYTPPPTLPSSAGPPSVLRPEHAMRPYKEDSDDEGGYIMRAWQPFPRPGYAPVDETPTPPPVPKSGFARVGGGRAHYDSPYAIQNAGGSSMTFPSVEQHQQHYPPHAPRDDEHLPTASLTNVARYPTHIPGGMQHQRKISQTAIIEGTSFDQPHRAHAAEFSGPVDTGDDGDDSDATDTPKRRWFNIRSKNKRRSETMSPRESEAVDPAPEPGGSSFVVVRKGAAGRPGSSGTADTATEPPPRPSFTVLRGHNASKSS